jgi:GNAT superfamily N-acetyltransferase
MEERGRAQMVCRDRGSQPSAGDLRVAKASQEDAPWIADFQVAMAQETEGLPLDPAIVRSGVSRVFGEPQRGFYAVAREADGTAVGCLLVLKEWSDWRNGDVWWLHSVYVAPACRKRGVFKRMFHHVEELARSSGARGLRLYVEKGNDRAKAVYSRLGMGDDHYELFEKMF